MSAPHISNFPTMSQFLWPSWCRASDETIHTGKPPGYVEIAMASYRLVLATHFSPLVGCILRGVAEMLGVSFAFHVPAVCFVHGCASRSLLVPRWVAINF